MSDALPRTSDARLDALELRYRRVVGRWYPHAWLAAHGDALIGTLLDVAEHRGTTSVPLATHLDLARRGVALRAATALAPEVRVTAASIGTGWMVGFALALVLTSGTRSDLVDPLGGASVELSLRASRLLALAPFLAGWLLVAVAAVTGRSRVLRVLALGTAVLVTLAWVPVWFSASILLPPPAWWGTWRFLLPSSAANLVLLTSLGAITLLARPRLRTAGVTALVGAAVAVAALPLRTGRPTSLWPDWFWTPTWGVQVTPLSVPVVVLVASATAIVLARSRRRARAVALLLVQVPLVLGCITELVIDPQVLLAL